MDSTSASEAYGSLIPRKKLNNALVFELNCVLGAIRSFSFFSKFRNSKGSFPFRHVEVLVCPSAYVWAYERSRLPMPQRMEL